MSRTVGGLQQKKCSPNPWLQAFVDTGEMYRVNGNAPKTEASGTRKARDLSPSRRMPMTAGCHLQISGDFARLLPFLSR